MGGGRGGCSGGCSGRAGVDAVVGAGVGVWVGALARLGAWGDCRFNELINRVQGGCIGN